MGRYETLYLEVSFDFVPILSYFVIYRNHSCIWLEKNCMDFPEIGHLGTKT